MHYIQKYILDKLIYAQFLRNRDMRPPNTESNLYQYHLKRLIDSGYVFKNELGYSLSSKGLQYADKHSSDLKDQRPQPKLVTILRLTNSRGEILIVKKAKQPFIGLYNLPSGKIHEAESLIEAGERELKEKVGISFRIELKNVGTVHLLITDQNTIISESYGFILEGQISESQIKEGQFVNQNTCNKYRLMPGVKQVIGIKNGHHEVMVDQY